MIEGLLRVTGGGEVMSCMGRLRSMGYYRRTERFGQSLARKLSKVAVTLL